MKLRLPNKLQAALVAALASVSFTTLSSGTIAVATGAALLAGQQAAADYQTKETVTSVIVAGQTYSPEGGVIIVKGDNHDYTPLDLGSGVTAEYTFLTSTNSSGGTNQGRYKVDSNAATRMANYGTIILAEGTVGETTYRGGQIFVQDNVNVTNDLILGTSGYSEGNGWAGSIRMSKGSKFSGAVDFVQNTTLVVGGNATFSGTMKSGDDVTVTLMKTNTLTFTNGGHANIHKVVLQESNLTINQTEQSSDMGQLYTGTVEVKGGRTLTLTPKSTANQTNRNNAPTFNGDVILSGTSASSKAQLTYTDGSTYITGTVDLGDGGYGRMHNSWDKQQHINALKGTNATLELYRSGNSGNAGYYHLYSASEEGYTGTIKLINANQEKRGGLAVHDAPTAIAGAVVDFSESSNKALLAFLSGVGTYGGNQILADSNTWTNGTVAGLSGTPGTIKAAALTINTAAEKAYTYGGDLGVSSLIKEGTGSQAISNALTVSGGVDVNAGTLVLGSSLTSATLSVAQDATLKLAGSNTLTISGSLTLAEGAMLDAANIAYSESPVILGTVGTFTDTGAIVTNVASGYKGELSVGDSNNLLLTFVQVGGEMAWHGTQESHNWNNNVWNDNANFVAGSIAGFAAGAHAVVDITDAQSANKVNVGGQAYTFNLAEGGALSANSLNVTSNSLEIVLNGGSLTPGDITIEQDATLTISGTGSLTIGNISGAGALVKADASTITLNQALSGFSGTIAVNAGTLVAAADNTLGAGVNVGSGGTLVLGVHTGMPTINGSGTVKITDGNFQYNDNASYLEDFSGKVLIANGGLVQIGNHASKFAAASSLEIGTGGTLKGWGANFTKGIVLSGGTLADAGASETYSGAINVTASSTVDASSGNTVTLSGALSGTGELTKAGAGALTLTGNNTGFAGGLYADAGTVNITTATTLGSLRLGSGALNIKADTTVSGTFTIGPSSGHYSGTLTVDEDKTLSVSTISSPWGFNGITVNGTLTVRDGGQFSITSNQSDKVIGGTGIINTPKLVVGNSGTKAIFAGGLTLNIGDGGITGSDASHIKPVEFRDVTVGVLESSNGWSAANAITLAAGEGKATTFNIGADKTVTLNGAVSGSGSLVKNGAGVLELTSASGYTGTYTVNEGELLFVNNLPNTLTAGGNGELHLMGGVAQGQDSQSTNLKKVIAPNLHLDRSATHNSRFGYVDGSDLAEVGHLYFDGAQLWVTNGMEYAGAVTFNTTTYTERNQDILAGSAMRVNQDATFSGTVEVAQDTKLAWGDSSKTVTFANKVTGDGDLNLKSWNSKTGTFKVSGDASEYAGAMTTDSRISLEVAQNAKLHLAGGSNLQGSVRVDGDLSMDGNGSSISGAVTGSGKLAKTGEGTTQVSGSMASYTGSVDVAEGTLNVLNATNLSVKDITIGTNATMGVYSGTEAAEANEGKVTMAADTTLKAGAGATLIANLEMKAGSTLTVMDAWQTGLTMGSDVYLNTGNLLGEGDLTTLDTLGFGEYYYLFNGVDNLYINDAQVGKLDFKDWQHFNMDANQVFTNLTPQTYALVYNWDNGANVGSVALTLLPEPTTGTLSLLALCALAARRRRK